MLNPKQKAFLKAFGVCGNVAGAAKASKVGRRTHYGWLEHSSLESEEYSRALEAARRDASDRLEELAWERATEGTKKPYVFGGQVVTDQKGKTVYVTERSDTLLIFLMKANNPEKYRDNAKIEHTGPSGGPLTIQVEFVKP